MAANMVRLLATRPSFVRVFLHHEVYSVRSCFPSVLGQPKSTLSSYVSFQDRFSDDYTRHKGRPRKHGKFGILAALMVGSGLGYYVGSRHRETSVEPARLLGLQLNAEVTSTKKKKKSNQFNFLADVVEKAAPAVVSIQRKEKVVSGLFGRAVDAVASGSGFLVSGNGLVVTNAHVVGASARVRVQLQDGRWAVGRVVDADLAGDLALLRLDLTTLSSSPPNSSSSSASSTSSSTSSQQQQLEPLPYLEVGHADTLRPGEWVVAMGSPLTLANTTTAGVVSCVRRPSQDLGLPADRSYIQTDAAITVGNSGGPLVDLDGRVVGVNTLAAVPGISFAIPGDAVADFVRRANKDVMPEGTTSNSRYVIGISMVSMELIPSLLGRGGGLLPEVLSKRRGVFVARVVPGEPGHSGGLRRGDVIVSINGRSVTSPDEVLRAVQAGRELRMEVVRDFKENINLVITPQLAEY